MPILLGNSKKTPPGKLTPIVPLREGIVFPHTEAVLSFGRPKSTAGIEAAFKTDRVVCFVSQKNPSVNEPRLGDIYKVGTLCTIERILETENEINALVKGKIRVKIESLETSGSFLLGRITGIPEMIEKSDEMTALAKHLADSFKKAVNLGKSVDFLVFMRLADNVHPSELADQVAATLDLKTHGKQQILETINVKERLKKVIGYLSHEIKILEIEKTITSKTQEKFDKSMKETILRERMKTIQKELGEDREDREITDLRKKIKNTGMPVEIEKKAEKELQRLAKMHTFNPEAGYVRTYLDWLIEVPWSKKTSNNVSIKNAQKVLDKDHFGLDEVKERILEYLAVMKLKEKENRRKDKKKEEDRSGATILCFVGPPGVGKTSIGKSIAKALGRKFVRISLGGIRDEAEIRGHRRTYVGAMPGRIIQGVKNAGTKNPVFMLDEIDKVGADFRGDPSAALLEALDPEQNSQFSDHYLEVPFDLSKVMFITTANILDTIPDALRDRLEVIRFSGYTQEEKFQIAKRYLIEKTMRTDGLRQSWVEIPDNVIQKIIAKYTKEAGVRNLEREIAKIMRKVAKKIAQGNKWKQKITLKNISSFLGPAKYTETLAEKEDEVGVATGLAWTSSGGEILFIEVALMPGRGKLILTGQLGEVMKESCKAALSFVRSYWKKLGIKKDVTGTLDIHIHVPEGAVPKDGPSAGVAIATALTSALTKKKARKDIGMTGEITLRGKVLEIGGVKEKVIAANRAGLKEVILPQNNKKDLAEIPAKIKKKIKFHFVQNLEEVLKIALRQ